MRGATVRIILTVTFFSRPTLAVARGLLGKYLVRRIGGRVLALPITEVEAYCGFSDRASHASAGMTPRNRVMFGPAGIWYVYFTYGIHWMLNIVTGREGYPAAVLIRGVGPVRGPRRRHGSPGVTSGLASNGVEGISGPARVTKFFKIDGRFNDRPACRQAGLWIEDRGVRVPPRAIRRGKRIGIGYAGAWSLKPWRFYLYQ